MIGIVLVSHGGLGNELLSCAESVVGKQANVRVLGLGPSDSPTPSRAACVKPWKPGAGRPALSSCRT
ncbi:MAG: hypothetical protein IPH91_07505 [Elusimicrobia bacterium]|nr:hypothetical protein [Elusimicrobiota bacterium]